MSNGLLWAGIYKIINIINNKVYIGSSRNITKRWIIHRTQLNKNKHYNRHLQFAWNKYGEQSFKCLIIEECSKELLIWREQHWINVLQSSNDEFGYNIRNIAESNSGTKRSEETKIRMSISQKGLPKPHFRNFKKWPHPGGYNCKCEECYKQRAIDHNEYRYKNKLRGQPRCYVKKESIIICN